MNGKRAKQNRARRFFLGALAVVCCLISLLPFVGVGGDSPLTARAEVRAGDLIKVEEYDVEAWVQTDRSVAVEEEITVTFLDGGLTRFFRSFPTEGARYQNIRATCKGNDKFSYRVIDNPDTDGFIDIECFGNTYQNATWTYSIAYTMQTTAFQGDRMAIDLIGGGWSVDLHDVSVTLHLPETPVRYTAYVGGYGSTNEEACLVEDGGRTLVVEKPLLKKVYNSYYGESMAEAITLDFTLPEGALASYADTELFTDNIGWLLLGGGLAILGALALFFLCRRKGEMITTVHIKPPKGMSPMQMGKLLDGAVDNEDTTSMIYYFASKGYLRIDLTDEKDPTLIQLVPALPEDAPAYEKTLFKGLFASAKTERIDELMEVRKVKVSGLVMRFYEASQAAKRQVPTITPMYTGKSKLAFALGGLLGCLFAFLSMLLMGKRVGGGYTYPWGFLFLLPVGFHWILSTARESYRYKWKRGAKIGATLGIVGACALYGLLFVCLSGSFFTTVWERVVIALGGLLPALLTNTLSRTAEYEKTLGDILGFKEFIVTTEEDKIKEMLKENPELYYDVLPYAQVLGVTDEWENKFAKITLEPPTWYTGRGMTVFDYLIIRRCMTNSLRREMARAIRASQGGGSVGRSGGGGGFGGFGGGGFGGGGGGAR